MAPRPHRHGLRDRLRCVSDGHYWEHRVFTDNGQAEARTVCVLCGKLGDELPISMPSSTAPVSLLPVTPPTPEQAVGPADAHAPAPVLTEAIPTQPVDPAPEVLQAARVAAPRVAHGLPGGHPRSRDPRVAAAMAVATVVVARSALRAVRRSQRS